MIYVIKEMQQEPMYVLNRSRRGWGWGGVLPYMGYGAGAVPKGMVFQFFSS